MSKKIPIKSEELIIDLRNQIIFAMKPIRDRNLIYNKLLEIIRKC